MNMPECIYCSDGHRTSTAARIAGPEPNELSRRPIRPHAGMSGGAHTRCENGMDQDGLGAPGICVAIDALGTGRSTMGDSC